MCAQEGTRGRIDRKVHDLAATARPSSSSSGTACADTPDKNPSGADAAPVSSVSMTIASVPPPPKATGDEHRLPDLDAELQHGLQILADLRIVGRAVPPLNNRTELLAEVSLNNGEVSSVFAEAVFCLDDFRCCLVDAVYVGLRLAIGSQERGGR